MMNLVSVFQRKSLVKFSVISLVLASIVVLLNCEVNQSTVCADPKKCNAIVSKHSSNDTDITVVSVGPTDLSLNWLEMKDGSHAIEYRVVYAPTTEDLDIGAAATPLPSGVTLFLDWTKGLIETKITGLLPSSPYQVAVIARDHKGQLALLGPTTVMTSDPDPPVAGTALSFSDTSSSSVKVSWGEASDPITPAEHLEYRLVRSLTREAIDTVDELKGTLDAGVTLLLDWSTSVTSFASTGLADGKNYYFALIVRGQYDNYKVYEPASMQTLDISAPTPGGNSLSYSSVFETTAHVSWVEASDQTTAAAKLKYKLVKGSSASGIDTVAEIEAITGANLIVDWTENLTAYDLTGLSAGTSYYFAVLVKDAANNAAIYAPTLLQTTDTVAPSKGSALVFSNITTTSLTVSWGAATDTVTATSALQYKLVKASTEAAIDTVNEVDAITGANLVMDWTTATLTKDISGLSLATNYYFAVLVRDAAGNRRLYDIGLVSTDDLADPVAGGGGVFSIPNGTVAETSLTINWTAATDNATQTANLRYKVVAASSQAAIDTAAEADAITGSGLLMDWSSAVTSLDVTGLTPGTTYWFAILVEDLAGRKSLYTPVSQLTLDTHAPTVATGPSFSSVTTSSALVSWTAATDNGTSQSALQYKLVRASSSAAIDTVAEADAIAGGDIILNWTANTLSSIASGLADSTTHWFAVLVKDSLGNKALYGPASTQTLDASAPTLGSAITFNGFSSTIANQVTVNWGAATDVNSITPQASLKYKVVKAASSTAIDTQAEVDAITSGAALVMDWSTNILTINSTPINDGSSYYYTVAVKDLSGNEAIYTPVARSLRMFMTNTVSQGNLGGITGADAICEADTRHPTSSGVNVGTYKAMLVDGTNRIACVNASCSPTNANDGLNWVMRASTLYVRTDGTAIKETNSSKIWDFSTDMTNPVAVAAGISGVWMGLRATFYPAANNCSLWTSANDAVSGGTGTVGADSSSAVYTTNSLCGTFSYPLYCVEQ